METSAVPLLAEKQSSSTKLFDITPAEALERRTEFEPQIREVYDGYHDPERTCMKGPIKRRVPGLHYSYIDKEGFIVYWYGFDSLVAVFHNIILAYLSDDDNDIAYLSEFYAWAYWCDTGSTKLPQRIEDKAKEARACLKNKYCTNRW